MRGLPVLLVVLIALAAPHSLQAGTSATTALRITFWEDGAGAPDRVWTLRCDPAAGTLARPARACRMLAAGSARLFRPTPRNVACTEIYGGPQRARVVGTVGGTRVWATMARANGCEISRWDRLSPWLLPRGGVT